MLCTRVEISHVVWSVAVQLWEARAVLECGAISLTQDKKVLVRFEICIKLHEGKKKV